MILFGYLHYLPEKIGEVRLVKPMRQGDVILLPIEQIEGQKLHHLVLAEGKVTGHKHCISDGEAELYKEKETLYLRVVSQIATLTHEEHKAIQIPQGNWEIRTQREYDPAPQGWGYVND